MNRDNKIMGKSLVFDKKTQGLKLISFYLVKRKIDKGTYFDIVKKGE